jgi:hypothetical protein
MQTYRIPEANLPDLLGRLDRLTRKAAKLGLGAPHLEVMGHEDVAVYRHTSGQEWEATTPPGAGWEPTGRFRRFCLAALHGEAPVLPGWDLLAIVEHGDTEVGNVLRVVPGRECPAAYRGADGRCDHCNTVRRRLETFVLRHQDTGAVRQVGRNCLADFCRDPGAAEVMCRIAELWGSACGLCGNAVGEGWGGARGPRRAGTEPLLALTARIIRHQGWLSRGKARQDPGGPLPTADVVRNIVFNPTFFQASHRDGLETIRLREAARDVQEQDVELAQKAIEWARGLRPQAETLEDYLHNLLVVLTEETVDEKHLGIACSAVIAYQKSVGGRGAGGEAARNPGRHVGAVGERLLFEAAVDGLRHFDGQWGVRVMVRLKDRDGNVLVWWTGAGCPLKEGETYLLRGTVKKHGEYQGVAQTEVSRVAEEGPNSKARKEWEAKNSLPTPLAK